MRTTRCRVQISASTLLRDLAFHRPIFPEDSMRLKALLGLTALLLLAACTTDPTGPSTSHTPTELRADGGTNTVGSGG